MKNFYKYLFFLILGITIFILLNSVDRFSVGIPPSVTLLDFDPTTDPLFETTPIMQDQNLSPEQTSLKHNLQEAIRTFLHTQIPGNPFPSYAADLGILSVCKKLKDIRTTTSPNRVCLWVGLGYLEYLTNNYLEEEIIIICDSSYQALKYAQDSVKIHQALYPDSNKKFLFHLIDLSMWNQIREYLLDIIRDNGFVVSLFNISNVFDYLRYDDITSLLNTFNTHEGVSEDMYWIINSQSAFTWYIHKADAVQFNSDTGLPDLVVLIHRDTGLPDMDMSGAQNLSSIYAYEIGDKRSRKTKMFMNRITGKLNKDTRILTKYSQYTHDVFEYVDMFLQTDVHSLGEVEYGDEFYTNSEPGSMSTLQISKKQLYVKLLLEEETRYFNNCLDTWFNGNPIHGVFSQIYDNLMAQISEQDISELLRILKPFYVYNQREIAYLADREDLNAELLVEFILNPPSCFYAYSDTTLQDLLGERLEYLLWRKRPGRFELGYNQRRFELQNDRLRRYDGDELRGVIMLNTITGLNIVAKRDFHYLIIQVGNEEFKLWAGEYNAYTFTQSNEDLPKLQQLQTRLQAQLLLLELSADNNPNFRLVTSYPAPPSQAPAPFDEFTHLKDILEGVNFSACSA